jgi:hypothetical protein
VKKLLSLGLAWSMLATVALRAEAEAMPVASPTAPSPTVPVTAVAPTVVATVEAAATPAATPEIPDVKTDAKDLPANSGEVKDADKEVEIPKEAPVVEAESIKVTPEKQARFRWGNLFLGALGGGILGAGSGFLLFTASKPDGTIDYNSAGVVVPVSTVIGMAVGGGLSVLLGLTTPLPAVPPSMNSGLDGTRLAWEPFQNGQRLILTTHF